MIDFKGFKKTHEDDKMATMSHPNGHSIKIVKASLSPENQKHLSKLPLHQADPDSAVSQPSNDQLEASRMGDLISEAADQSNIPPEPSHSPEEVADTTMPTGVTPTDAGPTAPYSQTGMGAMPGTMAPVQSNPALNQAYEGTQGQAAAGEQLGKSEAAAYGKDDVAQKQAFQDFQNISKQNRDTFQGVLKDLGDGQIDPNKYIHEMGAGKKIATAIGLFLGGIGAAKTGGPNPALQFLQDQIGRDLRSQQMNIENKHTLLSALQMQYGDQEQAYKMAAAIQTAHLANQLGQAAATNTSAMAKANGQMGTSQIMQQAQLLQRQANLIGFKNSINGSTGSPQDVDAKANLYRQALDMTGDKAGREDFEKHFIPSVGVASVPLEPKDRDALQKQYELRDLLNRAGQHLDQAGPVGSWTPAKRAEADTLQAGIIQRMGELSDSNRYNPEILKMYQGAAPSLNGTHLFGGDKVKLQQLQDSNDKAINIFYKQKGIPVDITANNPVRVIAPNGQSGTVPKAKLNAMISKGYRPVGQ